MVFFCFTLQVHICAYISRSKTSTYVYHQLLDNFSSFLHAWFTCVHAHLKLQFNVVAYYSILLQMILCGDEKQTAQNRKRNWILKCSDLNQFMDLEIVSDMISTGLRLELKTLTDEVWVQIIIKGYSFCRVQSIESNLPLRFRGRDGFGGHILSRSGRYKSHLQEIERRNDYCARHLLINRSFSSMGKLWGLSSRN